MHSSVTKFPSSISVRERQQLAATASTAVGRIPLREEGQPGPRLPHRQHGLHQRAHPPAALLRRPLQPVRPRAKSGKLHSILHLPGKQEDGSAAATGTAAEGVAAKAAVGKGGPGAEAVDAAEDEEAAAAAAEAEPEADEEEAAAPETDSVDGLLIYL